MNKNKRFYVTIQCLHEMTGSCFLISVHYPNGKVEKFTIDCGRFDSTCQHLNEFFPFDPLEIIFSICTHAHDDHISRYPLLYKQGFLGTTYATSITVNHLARYILYSNSRLFKKNYQPPYIEPLYNDNDVEKALRHFSGCPYRRIIKPTKNISFILYENGHIPGACMVFIVISYPGEKDIRLLFTGDYHYKNTFFNVPSLPPDITDNYISLLVTEATYGTTNSYDNGQETKILKVCKNALESGKSVYLPSFALHRAQQMVYLFSCAQKSNILPSTSIILDGRSAQYFHNTYIYQNMGFNINTRLLLPNTLKYIKSINDQREILEDTDPKVVIAPGGCSDYGSIVPHLRKAIPNEQSLILYPGYTSPNSTGGILRSTKKGDYISYHGEDLQVLCDVEHSSESSGHAKKDELFDHIYNPCKHLNSILTNHGEVHVQQSLVKDLSDAFPKTSVNMINSMSCYTVDASGIIQFDPISIYSNCS